MSASKGDLAAGTLTGPSNDQNRLQSSSSTFLGTGKRRRCEFEDSTSAPEPCLDTSQVTAAEQLPSPKVTNSSSGPRHPGEFHSNLSLSQKPPTEPPDVANPITKEPRTVLECEAQDWQIRRWVLGTEGSEENNPQPPPIEPYPDPDPPALAGMPPAKRKWPEESLGPASSYDEDRESIDSTVAKSNFYSSPALPTLLELHGIYLHDSASGLDEDELKFCQKLLSTSAPHPPGSMLDEDIFLSFSQLTRNKSEQWLVKNMHSHLFPAPELLALRGHDKFKGLGLIEGCGDKWLRAISPSYGKCPQPDSTMGFKWENFSMGELRKLGITIGLPSKYMARDDMLFPFITREAKCDNQPLEIADRQNVYSMSIALEGVIDLFRRAGELEKLNGKALGLSMSYDNNTVRMYAHHVVINAQEPNRQSGQPLPKISTMKYQTTLGQVTLNNEGGKDRWKPYDFFYNACLKFSERHLKRIKEAIALLPSPAGAPFQSVPKVGEVGQEQVGDGVFKKPRNGGVTGELRTQLAGLQRQLEDAKSRELSLQEESRRRESALQAQLEEQKDDIKRRESALQTQMDRLLQLLEAKSN
ncbi:hypothetical protein DV737_g2212, partial [Chaetothyriales sp. CBS 132003]